MTRLKKALVPGIPREGRLPAILVSRSVLDQLRAQIAKEGIQPTSPEPEPDWTAMRSSLRKRHKLTAEQTDELVRALERLWLLPFHRYDACWPHMEFFFTGLPGIEKRFAA